MPYVFTQHIQTSVRTGATLQRFGNVHTSSLNVSNSVPPQYVVQIVLQIGVDRAAISWSESTLLASLPRRCTPAILFRCASQVKYHSNMHKFIYPIIILIMLIFLIKLLQLSLKIVPTFLTTVHAVKSILIVRRHTL